jgi:hypothetical protein
MPKFKSSKKSSRGTLNFNTSTSFGQKHPSNLLNSQSPNQSAAPSPVNLEEKLDNASSDGKPQSALKLPSYATPLQNPLPAAPSPTTSPTSQLVIGLGELPKNCNGALFVILLVPPVPPTAHPCNLLVGGIQVFLRIGSKFDRSLVLCPPYNKDSSLPTIPAAIPQACPASYETFLPFVDVPNKRSLQMVKGKDRQGRKQEQKSVYATLSINSDIDCRHRVRVSSPLLDMRKMSLSVKPLQNHHGFSQETHVVSRTRNHQSYSLLPLLPSMTSTKYQSWFLPT